MKLRSHSRLRTIGVSIALVSAMLLVPQAAAAQERPHTLVRQSQLGGTIHGLLSDGQYAYAQQGHSLVVYDIRDRSQLRRLVEFEPVDGLFELGALDGDDLYLLTDDCAHILDVRVPWQPAERSRYCLPPMAYWASVAVVDGLVALMDYSDITLLQAPRRGSADEWREIAHVTDLQQYGSSSSREIVLAPPYLYVGTAAGLYVFDVSNPERPEQMAFSELGYIDALGLAGDDLVATVYSRSRSESLVIALDVSSPRTPAILGTRSHPQGSSWYGLIVAGSRAWVDDSTDAFNVISLVDKSTLPLVDRLILSGRVTAMVGAGDALLVATEPGGLTVFDALQDRGVRWAGDRAARANEYFRSLDTQARRAFLVSDEGLLVFDTTAPSKVVETDRIVGDYVAVRAVASRVYAAGNDGIEIYSVDQAGRLEKLGVASAESGPFAVAGERLITGLWAETAQIHVFDLSNERAPVRIGSVTTTAYDYFRDIDSVGSVAATAAGWAGVRIIDISDPSAPLEIGIYDPPGIEFTAIRILGQHAYAATNHHGLLVLDLSDPHQPRNVGSYRDARPLLQQQTRLDLDGTRLVMTTEGGIQVLDLSGTQPTLLVDVGGDYIGAALDASWLFAASYHELHAIEVRGPHQSSLQSSDTSPWTGRKVSMRSDRAYVATSDGGLAIIDVSEPDHPIQLGRAVGNDALWEYMYGDIVHVGDHVFSSFDRRLYSFDVSNPRRPERKGHLAYSCCERFTRLAAAGERIYGCSGDVVDVIDVRTPGQPKSLSVFPLPVEPERNAHCEDIDASGNQVTLVGYDDVNNSNLDDVPKLWVVDVNDVGIGAQQGVVVLPGPATALAVSGETAYVTLWATEPQSPTLTVVDLTLPSAPRILRTFFDRCDDADQLLIHDSQLVCASWRSLEVFDISSQASPQLLFHAELPFAPGDNLLHLALDGNRIAASTLNTGLTVAAWPPLPPIPKWPDDVVKSELTYLLGGLYSSNDAAPPTDVEMAPLSEGDKVASLKDPDTLWEQIGRRFHLAGAPDNPSCHAARTQADFDSCAGARLALTVPSPGRPYQGGPTLFSAGAGFYPAMDQVLQAGHYALYHAYVHDFMARATPFPVDDGIPVRASKGYHARMMAAYERHQRAVLVGLLAEGASDPHTQLALTRSVGLLAISYARTIRLLDRASGWSTSSQKADALALLNGLMQRIWWEWVDAQSDGPPTAGLMQLGSEANFDRAIRQGSAVAGANRVSLSDPRSGRWLVLPTLRPAVMDRGGADGMWFDADFAHPGESWCNVRFGRGSADWRSCMAQAADAGLGGRRSPFGDYFGTPDCGSRTGTGRGQPCGETNLGSVAEEWAWSYLGGRLGTGLIDVRAQRDPSSAPPGRLTQDALRVFTERLGFGVSGWHGGAGKNDDLEWFTEDGRIEAIRTLSAGRHDGEAQTIGTTPRYSLGEQAVSPRSSAFVGDTWLIDGQEGPGAIENHAPGPSPLYGTLLFQLVLSDRAADGLAPSWYHTDYRNHPEEFLSWYWLLLSTYYRCTGVSDPADNSCLAFDTRHWPAPSRVNRHALFVDPEDTSTPVEWRYLWRDDASLVPDSRVSNDTIRPDGGCRVGAGLPWARVKHVRTGSATGFLVDESGYGAYNHLLQGMGAIMRLSAARDPLVVRPVDAQTDSAISGMFDAHREGVIRPWFDEARRLILAIVEMYDGWYVPDIENAPCAGDDGPLAWRPAMGATVEATAVHRAQWYSAAALWYWWFDDEWASIPSPAGSSQ